MKTLLIDNYDSFTYNLFQLLSEANGEEPIVVRNDELGWEELAAQPRLRQHRDLARAGQPRPRGGLRRLRRRDPPFARCRCSASASGTRASARCTAPRSSTRRSRCTAGSARSPTRTRASSPALPREFQVVRYHSLCVEQPLPPELKGIAWTSDGILMAVAHASGRSGACSSTPSRSAPSTAARMLARFRDLTVEHSGRRGSPARSASTARRRRPRRRRAGLELRVKRLDTAYDTERAFAHLYGDGTEAFWLDSSMLDGRARFSFMGDASGPLGLTISYDVGSGELTVEGDGETRVLEESIFDYLSREMRAAALPLRRPAVRLQLRLRRLLRLRAEGRLRGQRRPFLDHA